MSTQMDYEFVTAEPLPAKPAPVHMTMEDRGGGMTEQQAVTDDEDSWWKKPPPGK
jgi:hypothetical protein